MSDLSIGADLFNELDRVQRQVAPVKQSLRPLWGIPPSEYRSYGQFHRDRRVRSGAQSGQVRSLHRQGFADNQW